MKKKWRAKFREEMREDANRIMEEVNSDPDVKDVEAPEEIHQKLMQQIRAYEGEDVTQEERLTAEEKELIQLGRVYRRTRKWNRYVVVAAAIVTALALGITSIGGPQKVIQVVREMVNERERTKVNIDDERIEDTKAESEFQAYLDIETQFESKVVRLYYLPDGLQFSESSVDETLQRAKVYYEGNKGQVLMYNVWFNSRSTSTGADVEDELLREYTIEVGDQSVLVKQYLVEGKDDSRWRAEFEHQNVHYFIVMSGLNQKEVEKIVKNLHFY